MMNVFVSHRASGLACALLAAASLLSAQSTVKQKIDVGFATLDELRPILEDALSPVGKFVMLPGTTTITVIDTPRGVASAEAAIASADFTQPDVALDFEFVTGLPSRTTSITVGQEVPFPTEYAPPTLIVGPTGVTTVVPATPTRFERRNIGISSETRTTLNPDGSMTVDTRTEQTEFEGFIRYGSAILPPGGIGTVPIAGRAANPGFFSNFIDPGAIQMPIFSTTRVTTSIVIRPRVSGGKVYVDMIPRLEVEPEPEEFPDLEPEEFDLRGFQTTIELVPGEPGRIRGFHGAGEAFHRHFFGAENLEEGAAAIRVKAELRRPEETEEAVEPAEAGE